MYELYNNYDNLYQNRKIELEQNLEMKRKLKGYRNQQNSGMRHSALIYLLALRNLFIK